MFSVIIPVFEEAERIQACLDRLSRQFPEEAFEVIVVDGEPAGSTLRAIHQRNDMVALASPPGRGRQMNAGVRAASGEILLFLHADTQLPDDAFQEIRRILSDDRYAAGAFTLRFDSRHWAMRVIAVAASWRYRITRYPYGDQAMFTTRAYFDQIGGYREIPIMEDLDLMRRIKQRGDRIGISRSAVLTSARRWETEGIVYSTLRTWLLASLFCLGVPAEKLAAHYRRQSDLNVRHA